MYASPLDGRMNRANFIFGQLILVAALTLYAVIVFRGGVSIFALQDMLPVIIIAMIPQIVLAVRRVHDMDMNGLWSIVILMPYVSLIFAIYISAKEGTPGTNTYGPPDNRKLVDSLLNKVTVSPTQQQPEAKSNHIATTTEDQN